MEEFLLRIGVNGAALKQELGRLGAYTKAWATTLAEDFKGKIGRMFAAGFALEKGMELLEGIKERILAIKRAQGELPVGSSAFVQNVFNYMERVGLSFEQISKPLLKFKQLLDAAKMSPGGAEMRTLERYNIITSEADLKTQKYATSVAKLSKAYLESGKNLKVLQDLVGKSARDPALLALLELGPEKIEKLNRFNPFSDFSQGTTDLTTGQFGRNKGFWQILSASIANLGTEAQTKGMLLINPFVALNAMQLQKKGAEVEAEDAVMEKVKETNEQAAKRIEITNKQLELTQKQKDLESSIADRGKSSVSAMAEEARRLTGAAEPRLYGFTQRTRLALKIDTLEKKADIAWKRGNDALHDQLMVQAQSLRASDPGLMAKDRNPDEQALTQLTIIKSQLEQVNQQLVPLSQAAATVNHDSHEH